MKYLEKHPMIMIVIGGVMILGGVYYYSRIERESA